jgi:hypothetical protein
MRTYGNGERSGALRVGDPVLERHEAENEWDRGFIEVVQQQGLGSACRADFTQAEAAGLFTFITVA